MTGIWEIYQILHSAERNEVPQRMASTTFR